MNNVIQRLRTLSNDELYAVSEAIDLELNRRSEMQTRQKSFRRTTYMADMIRGRRLLPRYREAA